LSRTSARWRDSCNDLRAQRTSGATNCEICVYSMSYCIFCHQNLRASPCFCSYWDENLCSGCFCCCLD
jgi:hypothetical protein